MKWIQVPRITLEDTHKAPACVECKGKHVATKCRTLRRLGPKDRIEQGKIAPLVFLLALSLGMVPIGARSDLGVRFKGASAITPPFCTELPGPLALLVQIPRAPASRTLG